MTGVVMTSAIVRHRAPGGIGHVDNHRRAVLSTSVMALLHDLLQLHLGAVAHHRVEGPAADYYGWPPRRPRRAGWGSPVPASRC